MIHDVDESLRALIRRDAVPGNGDEVVLDAPTRDWSARRNSPTLDLYLYDIREDLRRRENGLIDVHDDAGRVTARRRPPRYFKLSYLVTAWTQRPEDEHRLLSAVLGCFLSHDYIPPEVLAGTLSGTTFPIPVTVALPPPEDRALSDVWSALGGELKPSLDLVVTSPFEAGPVDLASGLVREGLRLDMGMSGYGDENGAPAPAKSGRGRGGAGRASRAPKGGRGGGKGAAPVPGPTGFNTGQETVVGGTRDEKGRIFRLRDLSYDDSDRSPDSPDGGAS